MEAALRGISLCLTMELLWPFTAEEQPWLDLMTASLWQHLRFIEAHSEFSFLLRSNHYLSNIVGLTTLSAYLDGPGMERRLEKYARAVQREILLQTYTDGGDCEASTGYHVLVAQMFLHSFIVQQRRGCVDGTEFQARLGQMFQWIASLADESGSCRTSGIAITAGSSCSWTILRRPCYRRVKGTRCALGLSLGWHLICSRPRWVARRRTRYGLGLRAASHAGKPEQKPVSVLPESGIAVLRSGEASVIFCAMPNGLRGKGSHTHCDKLSVIFRLGPDEVFCDSGSRCYTRSAELRNLDRSTRAHNTLMVDEAEQNIVPADPRLLFRCGNEAAVSPIAIFEDGERRARIAPGLFQDRR